MQKGDIDWPLLLPSDGPEWPLWLAIELRARLKDPGKPTILCLHRDQFRNDISVLQQTGQRFNYVNLEHTILRYLQQDWMPPELMEQYEYSNFKGAKYDAAWLRAAGLFERILSKLVRSLNLVGVMAANWDYWTDEGIRIACKKMGIPFLVLLRENYFLPSEIEDSRGFFKEKYKFIADVTGVAMGSDATRYLFTHTKVIEEKKIEVTGLPRFDPWIPILREPIDWSARDAITLITYTDDTYLAQGHFYEILRQFVTLAEKHRDTKSRFIVKAKNLSDHEIVRDFLSAFPDHRLILTFEPIFDVLQRTRVIIGFNSLAMIEALLSGAAIYVPQWGGTRGEQEDQLFWRDDPKHREHIGFMDSPAHFEQVIADEVLESAPKADARPGRIALFRQFVAFDVEVTATSRVEDFIGHFTHGA